MAPSFLSTILPTCLQQALEEGILSHLQLCQMDALEDVCGTRRLLQDQQQAMHGQKVKPGLTLRFDALHQPSAPLHPNLSHLEDSEPHTSKQVAAIGRLKVCVSRKQTLWQF